MIRHIKSIEYLENDRARVLLDGFEVLELDSFEVSQSRIEPDTDADESIIEELKFKTECIDCRRFAIKLINTKMRTEKQLINLLCEKGYSRTAGENAAEVLRSWGAVDDESYAREFMRYRAANSKKSWRTIFFELKIEGVDEEKIRNAAESFDTDEEKRAEDVAKAVLRGKTDEASLKKLSGTLQRNGFYWDEIKHVMALYRINEDFD